jgi:prepilin-type processing-associated H-X9-DG protein
MSKIRSSRLGFTMIEFLIILAILAFLLGVILPFVAQVRSVSKRAQSKNNLKMAMLGLHSCQDANNVLPPIVGSYPAKADNQGTIFFFMLPFLEQDNLYRQAQGSVWNKGALGMPVSIFLDPRDKSAPPGNRYKGWLATSNYAANWQFFKEGGASLARVPDGVSSTFGLTERYQMCHGQPCAWGYSGLYYWSPMFAYYSQGKFQNAPSPEECNAALAQSLEKNGINAAFLDGSVRRVTERISSKVWWAACTPDDGEVLRGEDFYPAD